MTGWPGRYLRLANPMMYGEDIKTWQRQMRDRWGYGWLAADGWFGPNTDYVTRDFQRRRGLQSDGIVGPASWAAA